MKKLLTVLSCITLIVLVLVSATGCATTAEAPVAESNSVAEVQPAVEQQVESVADTAIEAAIKALDPKRGEGKTIGVVAFFQANDWNRNALQAITDNLEVYGYTVNIIDGNGDAAKMNAAVNTHIANKVAGIIMAGGDGTALKSGCAKIVEAGIPYTVIDMFQEGAITNVMADNWGGGTQLGLYVVNETKGKGKVLILDTPSWVTLLARADAADVVFNPHRSDDPTKGIVVERFDIDAGNAVTDAQTKVAAALAADPDNNIKAIVTTWNLPAVGAYAALKAAGRTDDVVIASGDTGKDVLQAMREPEAGKWVFMGQNSYVLGTRAAQGLDLALNGQADLVPFAQFGPTYFVSNLGGPDDAVIDGSEIKLQSPEQHWMEVFGTEFGTIN
ncbi:MAG: substrate-binding domain-containing protein [Anaerolineae bacterium]|nr:substrate-binding domain-containing protein [Anaerolineae bacterium]